MFGRKKMAASETGPSVDAAKQAAEARKIPTTGLGGGQETVPAADQDGAKETTSAADQAGAQEAAQATDLDGEREAAQATDLDGERETAQAAAPDDESERKNWTWPAGLVLTVLGIAGLWAGVWLYGRTRGVRLLFASVFVGRIARYYWIALLIGAALLIAGVLLLRQAMRARPFRVKERRAKARWTKERRAAGTAEAKQENAQAELEQEKAQTESGQENAQAKPKQGEGQTEPERVAADNQTSSLEPTAQFCPKCGRILVPGAKFCGGCGAPISDIASR